MHEALKPPDAAAHKQESFDVFISIIEAPVSIFLKFLHVINDD